MVSTTWSSNVSIVECNTLIYHNHSGNCPVLQGIARGDRITISASMRLSGITNLPLSGITNISLIWIGVESQALCISTYVPLSSYCLYIGLFIQPSTRPPTAAMQLSDVELMATLVLIFASIPSRNECSTALCWEDWGEMHSQTMCSIQEGVWWPHLTHKCSLAPVSDQQSHMSRRRTNLA